MTHIELTGVELIRFEDTKVGDVAVPRSIIEKMDPKDFVGLPVRFVRGAMRVKMGAIATAHRGRDAIMGSVMIRLNPELNLEFDADKKKVTPTSLDYRKV